MLSSRSGPAFLHLVLVLEHHTWRHCSVKNQAVKTAVRGPDPLVCHYFLHIHKSTMQGTARGQTLQTALLKARMFRVEGQKEGNRKFMPKH